MEDLTYGEFIKEIASMSQEDYNKGRETGLISDSMINMTITMGFSYCEEIEILEDGFRSLK